MQWVRAGEIHLRWGNHRHEIGVIITPQLLPQSPFLQVLLLGVIFWVWVLHNALDGEMVTRGGLEPKVRLAGAGLAQHCQRRAEQEHLGGLHALLRPVQWRSQTDVHCARTHKGYQSPTRATASQQSSSLHRLFQSSKLILCGPTCQVQGIHK